MSDINWGLIRSGETFEDLICALIRFEDHQASLYLRRGRDDGQDARSGDGRIVYQMKFHQNEDVASAIKDAKAEAKKIAGYKSTLGLKQDVWRGVQEWILVSNVTFNPRDRQKWINEVEPLFAQIGLIATYWEKGAIEALLHKYPDLKQAYFSGESRVFLGIAEAHEQLSNEFPHPNALNTHYQGREEDGKYKNFLESDSKKIFVIHGAGGIGKTRFLLEGAKREALPNGWQVLWANVGAMSTTSSWFSGLIVERPTLLLIDEPDDAKVLQTLVEQISSGRSQKWKVAIAVRSPNDPVLQYFQHPHIEQIMEKLELKALKKIAAVDFCRELLECGSLEANTADWKTKAATRIAELFEYPIWIAIAVKVLEKSGDLNKMPQEIKGLVSVYLKEILTLKQSIFSEQKILELLRWTALLDTVNREDTTLMRFIEKKVDFKNSTELQRYFNDLINRNVISTRGARNRLLKIKPDVLADHILQEWLIYSGHCGNPNLEISSDEAKEIIVEVGTMLDSKDSEETLSFQTPSILKLLLRGIAKFELIQKSLNKRINLLESLLVDWYERIPKMNARRKLIYLNILDQISFVHVSEVLRLLNAVLNSESASETISTIFGNRSITHDDVILALCGVLDNIAPYAQNIIDQKKIISLLCNLIIKQCHDNSTSRLLGLANDEKRVKAVLSRIIKGGIEFRRNFDEPAYEKANEMLENIRSQGNISEEHQVYIDALVKPLLSLRQGSTFLEGRNIKIQTWFITPDNSKWEIRNSLRRIIKEILTNRKLQPTESEIFWNLLAYAHEEINQALLELSRYPSADSSYYKIFRTVIAEDLQWVVNLLESYTLDIQELTAARKIWDWHYQFKKYDEITPIAAQCERLFKQNKLFPNYAPLLRWDDDISLSWQEHEQKLNAWAIQTSQDLTNSNHPQIIHDFVQNGVKFLGNPDQISRLFIVAYRLGADANQSQVVKNFIEDAFKLNLKDSEFQFATRIAQSWVGNIRQNNPPATITVLKQILQWVESSEKIVQLITAIYENAWLIDIPEQEVEVVLEQQEHFLQAGSAVCFVGLLGSIFPFSSSKKIKNAIRITLGKIDHKQSSNGLGAFLQSLSYAMRNYIERCRAQKIKPTVDPCLSIWILNQVLHLPDIDNLSSTNVQYLKELLQMPLLNKPDLEWLVSAVKQRVEMASESEGFHIQILPGRERLSEWIAPISMEQNEHNTRNLISELLSYTDSYPQLGYRLPLYLFDIDPEGIITVDLILEKLADPRVRNDPSKIWRWAKFAGYYSDSSTAWYKIAHEVCSLAEQFHERDKYSIFHALTSPEPKIWMSNMGEVPSTFEKAVETAENKLESETDPIIVPFRQWMLQLAEAELSSEVERVKEEIEE